MRLRRLAFVAIAAAAAVPMLASPASAHPLGNFTSNTYAGVRVGPKVIAIDYVLDLAEIPTQQTMPAIDIDGDGTVSPSEASAYEASECSTLAKGLTLTVNGKAVAVRAGAGRLSFPPGLAGLSILRLECDLSAPVTALGAVAFHDGNLADRVGWHEVTAVGDGATLSASTVPTTSRSARLTAYPPGVPAIAVRDATFRAKAGGAAAGAVETAKGDGTAVPNGDRATRLFASLLTDHELTLGFGIVALVISIVLGAFHALAPGHGKTVMAAYVVGRKGGLRHAIGIGLAVAVTHTIGVLALGVILWSSQAFAAERIYPILGVSSGLLIAAIGVGLVRRVVQAHRNGTLLAAHSHGTGPGQHTHDWLDELEHELVHARERELALVGGGGVVDHAHGHHHDHDHDHHDHGHDHHDHHAEVADRTGGLGWGGIVGMGFAGGLVPSPSAVIVLLGALTLGRAWFGVTLVVAYGVGLALTLVLAGLVLVRAQAWIEPRLEKRKHWMRYAGIVPFLTALGVLLGGLWLAARAAKLI